MAARRAAAAWRRRARATRAAAVWRRRAAAARAAAAATGSDGRRARTRVRKPAASMRRRAGRDAWRGWLVHQFGRCASGALYPTGRRLIGDSAATRRTLARTTRSRTPFSIFVSTCSCAPRVFRRASQGPQGRVVPFGGGARRGPDRRLRTVQSPAARRPGRVPRFVGAYSFIIAPVNRTFVSGCGGSRHRGIFAYASREC
jgi:hypothetical protein